MGRCKSVVELLGALAKLCQISVQLDLLAQAGLAPLVLGSLLAALLLCRQTMRQFELWLLAQSWPNLGTQLAQRLAFASFAWSRCTHF